ncbi:hypothetical protein VKT23_007862 [Stygiomarasmius scandens]|uniref:Uncharacterized protein n=1 Tax=Marasmiellus scandens TaxID=2682957 RepID=A0ABR1JP23_9AGAR
MGSDRIPPLAPSRHAQLRAYAIRFTTEEIRSIPEYQSRRLIRPRDAENTNSENTDLLPPLAIVHLLSNKLTKVWPKARRGIVTIRGQGDSRTDGCAVVLADNSTRAAREIPTPEQLEEIQKLLGTTRKPR